MYQRLGKRASPTTSCILILRWYLCASCATAPCYRHCRSIYHHSCADPGFHSLDTRQLSRCSCPASLVSFKRPCSGSHLCPSCSRYPSRHTCSSRSRSCTRDHACCCRRNYPCTSTRCSPTNHDLDLDHSHSTLLGRWRRKPAHRWSSTSLVDGPWLHDHLAAPDRRHRAPSRFHDWFLLIRRSRGW